MVCSGVVRQGRIELEPGVNLPEGSRVLVELVREEASPSSARAEPLGSGSAGPTAGEAWREQWRKVAEQVTKSWVSPKSALETLSEMRR